MVYSLAMGVRLRIREVAEEVGITNAARLAALTGIERRSAYQLWKGEADLISTATIYKLCKGLGQRDAGALFEFVIEPDAEGSVAERVAKVEGVRRGRPPKGKE